MSSETLLLIGTLGGAFIGALFSMITLIITKSYDNKMDLRKTFLDAAISEWKQSYEVAQKTGGSIFPLDAYLIHHSKILDCIIKKKTTKEELQMILDESREISKMWMESSKQTKQEILKPNNIKNELV